MSTTALRSALDEKVKFWVSFVRIGIESGEEEENEIVEDSTNNK